MLLPAILARRAVRSYKSDPVADDQIVDIIKAGQFSPTAKHNMAVEFVVVRDPTVKEAVFTVVGSDFVKEAPALIVAVMPEGKSMLPVQDLSIASQSMMLQAAELGLGTVWKNVSLENAGKVKEALGIPAGHMIINIIPVGYAKEPPAPHTDAEYDAQKIHRERW